MDNRPLAVIFDRDGSLSSVHNGPTKTASKGSKEDKEQWREFNAALVFDSPAPRVAALLHAIRPGVVRIMVSGRAEGDHPGDRRRLFQMEDWLFKHQLPIDIVLMRTGGDFRKDSTVKREILVNKILPYYNPVVAVEDREEVAIVWEEFGIKVIRVTNDPTRLPPIAFQTP